MARLFSKNQSMLQSTTSCSVCGLHLDSPYPKIESIGKGKKGLMVVLNGVGAEEAKSGFILNDEAYHFLDAEFTKFGIDIEEDVRIVQPVICYSPTKKIEMACVTSCFPTILKEIKAFKPRLLILMGLNGLISLIKRNFSGSIDDIDKWRGYCIPDREYKFHMAPVYDIKFVMERLKNGAKYPTDKLYYEFWKSDIQKALEQLDTEFPVFEDDNRNVEILLTETAAIDYLESLVTKFKCQLSRGKKPLLSWDLETSGIKPYNKGHFIYTCAIASMDVIYNGMGVPVESRIKSKAFLATPGTIPLLKRLLEMPKIKKIAQNMKFEDTWAKVIWDVDTKGWFWDTMQVAHILDNREEGVTGLKFQAFARFGIPAYADTVSKYLESENSNAINNIKKAPLKDLLLYNGLDPLYTLRIALEQMKEQGMPYEL